MRWLALLSVTACATDAPMAPALESHVTHMEFPLPILGQVIPRTTTGIPCSEVVLPEPAECVAWLRRDGGDEQLLPPCTDDSAVCWTIGREPASCPDLEHQRYVVDHYEPTTEQRIAVFECVVL